MNKSVSSEKETNELTQESQESGLLIKWQKKKDHLLGMHMINDWCDIFQRSTKLLLYCFTRQDSHSHHFTTLPSVLNKVIYMRRYALYVWAHECMWLKTGCNLWTRAHGWISYLGKGFSLTDFAWNYQCWRLNMPLCTV